MATKPKSRRITSRNVSQQLGKIVAGFEWDLSERDVDDPVSMAEKRFKNAESDYLSAKKKLADEIKKRKTVVSKAVAKIIEECRAAALKGATAYTHDVFESDPAYPYLFEIVVQLRDRHGVFCFLNDEHSPSEISCVW